MPQRSPGTGTSHPSAGAPSFVTVDADDTQKPLSLRISAVLYGVGMLILLSPVRSDHPYAGQPSGSGGSTLCGLTLTAAFVSPVEGDDERERKVECAAKASDRVGYGLLALAFAAPFAAAACASRR